MYVKLVFSTGGSVSGATARDSHRGVSNLINTIIGGGSVQVGQAFYSGTVHEVSGTAPTAGIYTTLNNWLYSSPYYYSRWKKKHADNSNCTRDITMVFDYNGNYGQSFSVGTNGTTNTPTGSLVRSPGYLGGGVTTSSNYLFPYNTYWVDREVHIIITDDVFAVTQITPPSPSNSSVYTYIHMDFEYNTNIDDHLRTLNSAYYPGVEFGSLAHYSGPAVSQKTMVSGPITTFYSPQHYNGQTQSFQNMSGGGQSYYNNQAAEQMPSGGYIGVISPRMITRIPHRVVDLETVPVMVPVTFEGFRYGGQYWNEMPRNVKGMFRVSDDIVTNGDIINAGSPATEYRVLAPFNVNTSNSNQWTHVAFEV